jgi:hypothetical protein
MLSLKHYQFSIDTVAKAGHLRFKEHFTIRKTRRTLKKHFKLQISRSEVDLLCQVYLALTKADRQHDISFIDKLRSNGGVVLSIDGLQPEKGNETLWVLRDVQTGEVLLAKNLAYADTQNVASLLREVKALNIPVKGIVSDGQRSIRLAVKQEFPGVPHQLCHFHFLRNIAKPVSDMDRALKVDLKRKVRGIRAVESKAAMKNDEKTKVILGYCEAIHVALRDDGVYPLKPGGLRLWRCLRKIQRSMEKSNRLKPDENLGRLLKVLRVVDDLKTEHRRVKRLYKLIFEANAILKQESEAQKVQSDMKIYVDKLKQARFRRLDERAAVENILKFTESHWEGLFCHYDNPEIPRTNNDLEVYNRGLKSAHRKTTGRASCQGYIVRYGAYVALLDVSDSQKETLRRFRSVPHRLFRLCFVEIRRFRKRLSFKRRLSSDLEGFLLSQELSWATASV